MNLFEQVLQEASKSRFINPVWEDLEKDPSYVMSQTEFPNSPLPDKETITKWIDSGAAKDFLNKPIFDGKLFDWQKFTTGAALNDVPLYVYLINAYMNYQKEGGSRKQKKDNPKNCFKNAKISAIFLDDLENDEFFFVSPICYKDALWMDSFDCCGVGAKWCIGYEQSDEYWESYVHSGGNLFILAVNKENYKKSRIEPQYGDDVKYMIQIDPRFIGDCKAWRQSDAPSECIDAKKFKKFFGHNLNEFIISMDKNVLVKDNEYESWYWINNDGEPIFLYGEEAIVDDTLYFKDMVKGAATVSRQDIFDAGYNELKIDFEGSSFDGRYFSGMLTNKKDELCLSDFIEWAKDCGITNCSRAEFSNAEIKKVIFDVTDELYPFDFYFEHCNIDDIVVDKKVENVRTIDSQIILATDNKVNNIILPNQQFSEYIEDWEGDDPNFIENVKFQEIFDFAEELKGLSTASNGGDCTGKDMALLPDLENKEWIFIVPLTSIGYSYLRGKRFGCVKAEWNFFHEEMILKGQIPVVAFNKDIQKYAHTYNHVTTSPFDQENWALKEVLILDPLKYFGNNQVKGIIVENRSGVNNYKATELADHIKTNFGITIHGLINSIKKNIGPYETSLSDNIKELDNPDFMSRINEVEPPLVESKIFERVLRLS